MAMGRPLHGHFAVLLRLLRPHDFLGRAAEKPMPSVIHQATSRESLHAE